MMRFDYDGEYAAWQWGVGVNAQSVISVSVFVCPRLCLEREHCLPGLLSRLGQETRLAQAQLFHRLH